MADDLIEKCSALDLAKDYDAILVFDNRDNETEDEKHSLCLIWMLLNVQ